jgi:hypothetical protein
MMQTLSIVLTFIFTILCGVVTIADILEGDYLSGVIFFFLFLVTFVKFVNLLEGDPFHD